MTTITSNVDANVNASWQRTARLGVGADAAASGALGVLLLATSSGLDSFLGIAYPVLLGLAVLMLMWAAELTVLMRRSVITPAALRGVIAFNTVWVAASAVILAVGWNGSTALGVAFVITQALAGAAFTLIQLTALRASAHAGG